MRLIEGDRVTTQQVINLSASVDLVLVAAVGAFFRVNSSRISKIGHQDSPYRSQLNAVLQKSTPLTDDGSLSWAALSKKNRYINIETRLGWLSVQKKMLKYLEENIP